MSGGWYLIWISFNSWTMLFTAGMWRAASLFTSSIRCDRKYRSTFNALLYTHEQYFIILKQHIHTELARGTHSFCQVLFQFNHYIESFSSIYLQKLCEFLQIFGCFFCSESLPSKLHQQPKMPSDSYTITSI